MCPSWSGVGLCKVMIVNATFNNSSAISWWSVYCRRKPEYSEKTTDLPQGIGKLYPIMLYQQCLSMPLAGFELTTLVIICTDCTGSCKSNYHTITTTTATCNNSSAISWWSVYCWRNRSTRRKPSTASSWSGLST